MHVVVYIREDTGKQPQFLLLPQGESKFPAPAAGKTWRRLFVMNIYAPSIEPSLSGAEADLRRKGFAIVRPQVGRDDWSQITEEELSALEEPDLWQDKWHIG